MLRQRVAGEGGFHATRRTCGRIAACCWESNGMKQLPFGKSSTPSDATEAL
jgi:hypothetical protein